MGNHTHEISQKENDERLILIDLHNGRCPVCNCTYLTRIEDERHDRGFEQGIHIFLCDECGVVARKNVSYIPVRPNVYFYKYNKPDDIK